MVDKKQLIIFIFLFLIFIFFRFYNLPQRLSFDWDQEYYSYQVKKIINEKKLTLIGPRVNNDKGFFLAPYFFYLLVPFYLLTNFHPISLLYLVIFYNISFFLISFFVIKKLFNFGKWSYFILFWSINHLLISLDTTPWNPLFVPLGFFIVLFLLKNISQENKKILNYLLLGLVLGFFLNFHFQFIFIILFSFIFLFFTFRKKITHYLRNSLFIISGILITFFPLFIFDLRHNFLNLKLFFSFFYDSKTQNFIFKNWLPVMENSFFSILIFKKFLLFFYLLILISLVYLIKKKKEFLRNFFIGFLIIWLIFPIIFSLYQKRPSEYYFVFLYPFVFFTLIEFFFSINKKRLLIFYFLITVFFNRDSLKNVFKSYDFGLYYKEKTIKKLKDLVDLNAKFNITYDTPLGLNHGFDYLIDYYQIKQSGNFFDPLIEIRIPPKENDFIINKIGIKIPQKLLKK